MNYSLNPNRKLTHLVIDDIDEAGREGVYGGSYDDCLAYIKDNYSIGLSIIPNPNF